MTLLLVLFLLIHPIYGSVYTIQLTDIDLDCIKESTRAISFPIRTLSFNIWNNQLSIPGTLDLSLSFNVTKKLSNDIQYSTKIQRKIGSTWLDLPCLSGTSGCDKQSLCNLIQKACKNKSFKRPNNYNNPKNLCPCDLDIGTYTIEHIPIDIKRNKSAKMVKLLTTGQYRFKIKFETRTKTTVGCVIGYLTLLKPNKFT